jgi:uncharacterized membrane protein YqgA involved in biofilm formation
MPGTGTIVNAVAVLAGTALGLLSGKMIPERIRKTTMGALGLTVFFLGLQMALDPRVDQARLHYTGPLPYHPNPLIIIGGLVIGSILGEILQIEERLERFAARIQGMVSSGPAGGEIESAASHNLVEGFVTATLLYCVGAMAIIGSIQDAAGQPHVLYVKAMLDGIGAVMLSSGLGIGVGLSAFSVLLYQGAIVLAAGSIAAFLTVPVLATLTATGGLLIAAIGLDLAGIKRLPVGNMLPGIFVASILAYFIG